jgi:uncharacterized protein (TIGR03437 family)
MFVCRRASPQDHTTLRLHRALRDRTGFGSHVAIRARETLAKPEVPISSASAEVAFSGLAPAYFGLYQINVRVPADYILLRLH